MSESEVGTVPVVPVRPTGRIGDIHTFFIFELLGLGTGTIEGSVRSFPVFLYSTAPVAISSASGKSMSRQVAPSFGMAVLITCYSTDSKLYMAVAADQSFTAS